MPTIPNTFWPFLLGVDGSFLTIHHGLVYTLALLAPFWWLLGVSTPTYSLCYFILVQFICVGIRPFPLLELVWLIGLCQQLLKVQTCSHAILLGYL